MLHVLLCVKAVVPKTFGYERVNHQSGPVEHIPGKCLDHYGHIFYGRPRGVCSSKAIEKAESAKQAYDTLVGLEAFLHMKRLPDAPLFVLRATHIVVVGVVPGGSHERLSELGAPEIDGHQRPGSANHSVGKIERTQSSKTRVHPDFTSDWSVHDQHPGERAC